MNKVAVISLRFNPAFVSLLVAYGKAFLALGFSVEFLLDSAYGQFPEISMVAAVRLLSKSDLSKDGEFTHALFVNISARNCPMAHQLKRHGARILYVYHEPWESLRAYVANEGVSRALKSTVAHLLSVSMLKVADGVIILSKQGIRTYGKGDVRYNRNTACIPLLFDDEADTRVVAIPECKQYLSYIGTICQGHGFSEFLNFVRYSFRNHLPFRFMIASRSPLPSGTLEDRIISANLEKLTIRCGAVLETDEINESYASSFCVWNLYTRSTQSAVLPKALMFGTPVVASRTGAFPEFVKDGFNGRFADAEDCAEIARAVEDMSQNIFRYSRNCRQSFLSTFFYRSNVSKLKQLV